MDYKELISVDFSHLGNNDVQLMSVKEIKYPETYENSEPKIGGLLDPSLGSTTMGVYCSYCELSANECPGHWGHIELGRHQFHGGFINHIVDILQCICLDTCKLLVSEENIPSQILQKKKKYRMRDIKKLTSGVKYSPYTGYPIPKIYVEINKNKKNSGAINIVCEYLSQSDQPGDEEFLQNIDSNEEVQIYGKSIKRLFNPENCYDILNCISDKDCEIMGYSTNVQDLIIKYYPIPPVAIRPSLRKDQFSVGYGENNLTQKLSDIIKWNNKYKLEYGKYINSNELSKNVPDYNNLVQYHIYTYFDNETKDLPRSDLKSGGQPSKSLTSRYKGGKAGRIRANLMAKRVNFSARTVITSDPMVNTNEIGVPIRIAMKITYPEIITKDNIAIVEKLVHNGKYVYPGANYIEKMINGKKVMFDIRYQREGSLKLGDIIHRHLQDGDVILFNRQPSLHKMNMMSHKVRIINDPKLLTFRINVTVTNPYGADFDGDEMNLFAPQSIQAKCELLLLSNLYNNIISPKNSSTVLALKQDSLIGIYLLSVYPKKLEWHQVCNILSTTSIIGKIFDNELSIPKKAYTGNEVISFFLPDNANLKDSDLLIIDGKIKEGFLTKNNIGSKKNNLIHYLFTIYGNVFFVNFLDDLQRLSNNWLMLTHSFTIGINDFVVDDKINTDLEKERLQKVFEIENLLTNVENRKFLNREFFEKIAYRELDVIKSDQASYVRDRLDDTNNMYLMSIKTKSKGDLKNIGFTMTCMGQTAFQGKLIPYSTNKRTLTYFPKMDDTPYSRGFIFNNYSSGLKCSEFVYHNLDGRQGIIDTAIKTGDTGYLQRKLIKGAEDLYVAYDKTIRNSLGEVLQFVYGSCGYDLTKIVSTSSKVVDMCDSELKKLFVEPKLVAYVTSLRDHFRNIYVNKSFSRNKIPQAFFMPFNIVHYSNILKFSTTKKNMEKLSIDEIRQKINDLVEPVLTHISYLNKDDEYKIGIIRNYYFLYNIIFYEYFNPYILSTKYSSKDVNKLFAEIQLQMTNNLIHPGEMIGIVSAQSVGEPLTQFTLDTFHSTGSSSSIGGMDGIKSFIELINITKNMKVPLMYIYLEDEFSGVRKNAELLAKKIVYLDMETLIEMMEIVYDKNKERIKQDNILHGEKDVLRTEYKEEIGEGNEWTFRLVLSKEEMMNHNVTITDIKLSIYKAFKKKSFKMSRKKDKDLLNLIKYVIILSNTISDKDFIIHVRFNINTTVTLDILQNIWEVFIKNIYIKGIDNITESGIEEKDFYTFDPKTGKSVCKKEYIVVCKGINFEGIFNIYGVDKKRSYCNNIQTTYRYYGIEGARTLLINQFTNVFENGGITLNNQHFTVLADIMTRNGILTSINRYGLNKLDTEPLSKASFEKTMQELLDASIYEESDSLKSVSSRIMTGKVIKGGTGLFDVILDVDTLQETRFNADDSAFESDNGKENTNSFVEDSLLDF